MRNFAIFTFTLGLFAFQMVAGSEKKETPENIAKQCTTKTGATAVEIASLNKGDFSKPNEKIECYAKCILDHSEFLEDGIIRENILVQKLSKKYKKEQIDKAIAACKKVTGRDHCQAAFNLSKCYSDNKVKLI